MVTVVETLRATIQAVQAALLVITGLELTGYKFPQPTPVSSGSTYDFIIVGAGSGGSVLANRLTEIPHMNVLAIDAGANPPLESVLPGIFTLLPGSSVDFDYRSTDDGVSSQNIRNQSILATAGKMLGGGSSIGHLMHIRGNQHDYQLWAEATGDESWNYDNMLPYLMKSERLIDEDLLNSPSAQFMGKDGYLPIVKQPAADNAGIFAAFNEIGIQTVDNLNDISFSNGISEPPLNIEDGYRASNADYLKPLSERSNFNLLKNTQVTKILFDDNNNAIGVEAVNAEGETLTFYANQEVILAAGAFGTPKLLLLSGVGPSEQLNSLNIPVIADVPVGQGLQDHIPAVVVTALQPGEPVTAPANPHLFPVPTTVAYNSLNPNQGYSDYQSINLLFPPSHTAQIQICSLVFGYKDEICQSIFDGGAGRFTMLSVVNIMQTLSRGEVRLASANPNDDPIINHGIFSDPQDLENLALYLQDFSRIYSSATFQSIGAEMVLPDLPECSNTTAGSLDYFRCYGLRMSGTMWAYSSTCSLGRVLDNQLNVKGVQKVRVVDASAMPNSISANLNAAVTGLAERGADLIKQSLGSSPKFAHRK